VRSAVDVRRASGYQSSGTTSESCNSEYPFVSAGADKSWCCKKAGGAGAGDANCKQRNCKDERGNAVDCVDNGTLKPSQAAGALVELDGDACQTFSSFVERVQKKHGVATQVPNCHEARNDLAAEFKSAFETLSGLYTTTLTDMEENRTICLNEATYNYKAGVEGLDGIDDQIQDAAGKIHEAQGEIARLEPMLHDVERAVDRMRAYVQTVASECEDEGYLGVLYGQIRAKIVELQECPGRNDFIVNVPHWTTGSSNTPAPTPWYQDPKAASVRNQL
jgi:hypothetical protein